MRRILSEGQGSALPYYRGHAVGTLVVTLSTRDPQGIAVPIVETSDPEIVRDAIRGIFVRVGILLHSDEDIDAT